jgi:hypothetical protein
MKRGGYVPGPGIIYFVIKAMLLSYASSHDVNEFPWFDICSDFFAEDFQS